ncbi:leucine-rich repeat protein kinase family protein [Striga asiatica]|uniref:Leucine-rich repeat protein kinase family protein n=1 Tax=Striga asiatica TaxID=4170 RepID=A0A5A7PIC1_STRAF|nr:leucine-rich repeat protein kinase family protein [Striga asiatica]
MMLSTIYFAATNGRNPISTLCLSPSPKSPSPHPPDPVGPSSSSSFPAICSTLALKQSSCSTQGSGTAPPSLALVHGQRSAPRLHPRPRMSTTPSSPFEGSSTSPIPMDNLIDDMDAAAIENEDISLQEGQEGQEEEAVREEKSADAPFQRKKRKKTAKCWKEMTTYADIKGVQIAECNYCNEKLRVNKTSTTTQILKKIFILKKLNCFKTVLHIVAASASDGFTLLDSNTLVNYLTIHNEYGVQ